MKETRLADGIWLVETTKNSHSQKRISLLGELGDLYPFAQMMGSHDKLSAWLGYKGQDQIFGSIKSSYDGQQLSYSYDAPHESGREILKFLSLTPEQQDEEIDKLRSKTCIDSDGAIRDQSGKLVHFEWTKEAIKEQIKQKEAELKELRAKLKK